MESGSVLSKGDGTAARSQRKMKMLNLDQQREWGAKSDKVMRSITISKARECEELQDILLLTNHAQLYHMMIQRGKPTELVRFSHLEEIRSRIWNEMVQEAVE